MTEAETLEAIALFGANTWDIFAIYLSIVFAYLAVAYFIGDKLNRFQVIAVTGLFLISATASMFAVFTSTSTWIALIESRPNIAQGLKVYSAGIWDYYMAGLMVIGMVVSIYFMYEIRSRKEGSNAAST